jgi:PAS domain S-box-containing protein
LIDITRKPYEKSLKIPQSYGKLKISMQSLFYTKESTLFHSFLASSSDPIIITTPEAKIIYVNRAWEKLTGYTSEEVEGKNPNLLRSGKTPEKYYKNLWKAVSNGNSFTSEEIVDKRKDGSLYKIHSTIYPIRSNNKNIYYVQILHDISDRKHLEDLKSEFLSLVSHELKTPITVLKLLSQTHLARFKNEGAMTLTEKDLSLLNQECDRLTDLINDMLDSSRIETGKLNMNFEVFDLTELTQSTVEKIRIVTKDHKLIFDSTPKYEVIGDKDRVEQVLINLLTNAIKYSAQKSEIAINITKQNSQVYVSVKDKGKGIPKKAHKAIFDKFYQLQRRDGFGLGLYISKEIIKHHKGKIWVESIVGKGSTFYFSLPLTNF